jgi:hypothetical protein
MFPWVEPEVILQFPVSEMGFLLDECRALSVPGSMIILVFVLLAGGTLEFHSRSLTFSGGVVPCAVSADFF